MLALVPKGALVMIRIAAKDLEAAIRGHCDEQRYGLGQTFRLAMGVESFEGLNLRSIGPALRTLADTVAPMGKEPA